MIENVCRLRKPNIMGRIRMKYCTVAKNNRSGQDNLCRSEQLRESLALCGRVGQFRSPYSWITMRRSLRKRCVFDFVPSYLKASGWYQPLRFGWGLCKLHHCPQFPWIWKGTDRLGGKRKTDTCGPQRKGRLGEKKDGRFSIVSTVGSGRFCFQHGEVVSFFWLSQNVLIKRTRASHFIGLVTDPKLLCPIAMKSGPPKNIRVCWAFFGGRLTNILKFFADFDKKKNQNERKPECQQSTKHSADPNSLCPRRTGVLHDLCRVALWQVQWVATSTCLEERTAQVVKKSLAASHSPKDPPSSAYWLIASPQLNSVRRCCRGHAERENSIHTCTWQCSHSCPLSGKNSEREESNDCASKEQSISAESLLSWAWPFELAASAGFCATTLSWLESWLAADIGFLSFGTWKKAIRTRKKLVFSVDEWQICSRQFAWHPVPFHAFFVCAYAALHDLLSYALTYSHKSHSNEAGKLSAKKHFPE